MQEVSLKLNGFNKKPWGETLKRGGIIKTPLERYGGTRPSRWRKGGELSLEEGWQIAATAGEGDGPPPPPEEGGRPVPPPNSARGGHLPCKGLATT
ncbi:hypothetical protein Scep_017044 [Stephania cephalantha]|uniref:Uncharacterized protein n=1 Tax=Stephania cephalantha TaxID=152367 RepID=A0AAP0IQL5_9MAGN